MRAVVQKLSLQRLHVSFSETTLPQGQGFLSSLDTFLQISFALIFISFCFFAQRFLFVSEPLFFSSLATTSELKLKESFIG